MIKYKDPLTKNPHCVWQCTISGTDEAEMQHMAKRMESDVPGYVKESFGISVMAELEDVQVGGLLSKTVSPGVLFMFTEYVGKYASFLVGFTQIKGITTIAVVQYGSCSPAMQRINSAEAKPFSISGALKKAVTNTSAVEEEEMHYTALCKAIKDFVATWVGHEVQ